MLFGAFPKMARRHLETAGTVATQQPVHRCPETADFLVPPDMDAVELAQAIRTKLGDDDTNDPFYPMQKRRLGGRVVLRLTGRHIMRLGDGRFDKGRAFLHSHIKDQRAKRWRTRLTAGQ